MFLYLQQVALPLHENNKHTRLTDTEISSIFEQLQLIAQLWIQMENLPKIQLICGQSQKPTA